MNLLNIALIKSIAHSFGVVEIKGGVAGTNWTTIIKMFPQADVNATNIPELIKDYNKELKFTVDKAPFFSYTVNKKKCKDAHEYMNALKDLLDKMSQVLKVNSN